MNADFLDIIELIRSIQRAEGDFDCFRRAKGYCDRMDCEWRSYCLKSSEDFSGTGDR